MPEPENSSFDLICIDRDLSFLGRKKVLIIAVVIAFSISQPAYCMTGTWPRCAGSCTANDISSATAYMVRTGNTCYIYTNIYFTGSGTRYNMHIVYDLYQGDTKVVTNLVVCLNGNGCVTPDPTTKIAASLLVGSFANVPGYNYSLKNILFYYDTQTQSCTCKSGDCSIFPNSKCKNVVQVEVCSPPILSASNQAICLGNSVQLSLSASPAGGSYTYSWTPATGLSSTTVPNPIASPRTTTTYTVTVMDTVCKSSATAQVTVTVQGRPTALAGSYEPICDTDTVSLVGASTNYSSVWWTIKSGLGNLIYGSEPRYATFRPAHNPSKVFTQTVLAFTAAPISPCSGPISSDVTITVYQTPNITIQVY